MSVTPTRSVLLGLGTIDTSDHFMVMSPDIVRCPLERKTAPVEHYCVPDWELL